MSNQYRCTIGDERATFDSEWHAAEAGWTFATIRIKGRVKYFVACPEHTPAWLKPALADKKEKV